MNPPRIYGSKREIYQDFRLCFKFIPGFPVQDKRNYGPLLEKITADLKAEISRTSEGIVNMDGRRMPSHAFFLQIPSEDAGGNEMGPGYVLITHETGLEVFAVAAAAFIGGQFAQWALGKAFEKSFALLAASITAHWTGIINPEKGWKIERVEIRSEEKGVMTIDYRNFKIEQVNCLLKKWHLIKHISEANHDCFGDNLRPPPAGGWGDTDPRARDA